MSAIAEFRDALIVSLRPSTPAEFAMVDEQLAMALKATWANKIVAPLAAILISVTEIHMLPLWHVLLWPTAIMAVHLAAEIHYRRLLARSDHSHEDIGRRARASARITLLMGTLWCAMIFDLMIPGNVASEAVMFTVLACSLSAWASIGAYHLATGAAAMPSYLIALIAMPLAAHLSSGALYSCLGVAYWVLMRTHLTANYFTRERMIRLEQEREGLIGSLKAAKDDSDSARARAETASRAKSAFLANMSHELRTPLNAILGFSEIIASKATADRYTEYGSYIHASGEHLLSLINDILDLAKIEAGRLTLREVEIDLRRMMDDTAKMMGAKALVAGVTLAVHIERAFPNLMGDERAIRQILVNLTSNAIKFTPPGGRVTAFAGVADGGALAFGIDDTGIGIAAEDHARVFESFGQGRHDAILADKGTGLGLPIVKGLAEAHGGRVTLESTPDRGTRVTVVLPPERARARMKVAV